MASPKAMILQMVLLLQIIILIDANDRRQKFCGKILTEQLHRICDGRYAIRSSLDKRTHSSEETEYKTDDTTHPSYAYQSIPFAYSYGSISPLSPRVRRDWPSLRRGVVFECCINSCTESTLSQYCGFM
ncbi:hypothetical protein Bhyg_14762 [Pseudolycoriella hygida]|uniref:Insulin-like domain-containing protein n=1 Tax=Pseudolycoriella hygida TaxID=35572 RepID=A0A9Q0MR78_9DIPT|nr:hypothetical protein Bhyg_14762 [Pseudolycoriella hygida]